MWLIQTEDHFNVFPSTSRFFLGWRRAKFYSQTGWAGGLWPGHGYRLSPKWHRVGQLRHCVVEINIAIGRYETNDLSVYTIVVLDLILQI